MSYNGSGQGVSWYPRLIVVQRVWRVQLANIGRFWRSRQDSGKYEDCSGGAAAAGSAVLSRCELLSNTCRRQGLRGLEAGRGGDTQHLKPSRCYVAVPWFRQ